MGSSPLTRGKPPPVSPPWWRRGLIPAHAGKTIARARLASTRRAHPRSRGENSDTEKSACPLSGSSPLTRGKPLGLGGGVVPAGLIPAHAGKTGSLRLGCRHVGAHPRSRGENRASVRPHGCRGGSSPLTRGKQHARRIDREASGLIPAHAGKTCNRHFRQPP